MAAHRGTLPSATPPVVTPCTTLHSWPGSWLPSPAPASLTTGGAAAVQWCPAPWQCVGTCRDAAGVAAAAGSRIAAVQPSSGVLWPAAARTQQRPAWTRSGAGECRGGGCTPGWGAARTCSMSPAPAPAGGAAGGGGGAVLLPAVSLSTGPGCSAPRLLRRWNDNNLTIT